MARAQDRSFCDPVRLGPGARVGLEGPEHAGPPKSHSGRSAGSLTRLLTSAAPKGALHRMDAVERILKRDEEERTWLPLSPHLMFRCVLVGPAGFEPATS